MKFSYTVRTKNGKPEKGTREALSREEAEKALLKEHQLVLHLTEKRSASVALALPVFGGISSTDKIFFAKHLSVLLRAGVSLIEAFEIIASETASARLKGIVRNLINAINNGSTLSNALRRHPKAFSRMFIHVVAVGEESGKLEENLEYLAGQLEKMRDLKRKLIAAMMYPVIIFSFAIFVASGLIVFILPKLLPVFASFNVELPLTTRILIGVSSFFKIYGIWVAVGLGGVSILLRIVAVISPVAHVVSRASLMFPIFGSITKNLNLAFLARTMETLIRSGVPMMEAADITAETLGNMVYRRKLKSFSAKIAGGKGLGKIFEDERRLFPITFSRMVSVGERSGKLEESFKYLAEFYEKEVDNLTTNLANVLQPILLIIVGVLVGFIAIAIITPIYKFTESIRR